MSVPPDPAPASATHVPSPDGQPATRHRARAAEARAAVADARRLSARLSVGRLSAMGLAVLMVVFASYRVVPAGAGWTAAPLLVIFLVLVVIQDRVERRIRWHETVATWHDACGHRLARAWSALPEPWTPAIDSHHPFTNDLDLFGRSSVFALIGPPGTQSGRDVLAGWLLTPAAPAAVAARQAAVTELAAQPDVREPMAAHGAIVGGQAAFDLRVFLEWAEGSTWLLDRPWLVWLTRGLALAIPSLLAASSLGLLPGVWWLAALVLGFVVSWSTRHALEKTLGRATGWEPAIRAYVEWLRLVEVTPMTAPELARLRERLTAGGEMASHRIARFQRIVACGELRLNALLHFPIHGLTLWDFHVWWALERWQRESGRRVRGWLDALGTLEALVSVGTLAADHPDWALPVVREDAPRLEAQGLGHPLLAAESCVRNDVTVGPRGRVLCITGSNMSGKSTLLRAIGVNAVLAQAGAPVCARALVMPPVEIYTSLRILDSLEEGVSFFMAAIGRLARLVRAADRPGPPVILYLLDEILQGTNSAERETAVRIVLRHLLQTSAIGAITTHDLALTSTPELAAAGDHVHLRETIHDDGERFGMTFDYRLRPGVATSRNALALLRLVGLSEEGVAPQADRRN